MTHSCAPRSKCFTPLATKQSSGLVSASNSGGCGSDNPFNAGAFITPNVPETCACVRASSRFGSVRSVYRVIINDKRKCILNALISYFA